MNNNCIYQKLLLIKTLLGSYLLKGVLVSIYYRNSHNKILLVEMVELLEIS